MKFSSFKIFKFSTILKRTGFKGYIFSRILKKIKLNVYNFFEIFRYLNFKKYNPFKIYKYFNFRRFNLIKIYRYLNIKKYKYIPFYVVGMVIISAIIYTSIPIFFSYDKSNLENILCKDINLKCSIQGKIKYSFFPSPRINFKNLVIHDFNDKNKSLGKINSVALKLSFSNLLDKKKINLTSIELRDAKINLNLAEFSKYKKIYRKNFNSKPIKLKKGEINFFDDKNHISTIQNLNFRYKIKKNVSEGILKGSFLGDRIYVNLKKNKDSSKVFQLKLDALKLNTKVEFSNLMSDPKTISGNVLFKRGKDRIIGIFNSNDKQIIVKQATLRNNFLDGKFDGQINFLPYLDFNLNVDLNSINFNRLYTGLISLSDKNKKNLFRINKKINGQLNLSANKIFSKHTLINSLESRLQFINGNISVDQFLINLKKIGAADITGFINNDKKFSNFKFENNIFIDNLKRFYNKFGVFNKKKTASNLFISGNFDLSNVKLRIDEISDEKKFSEEDTLYIEKEFNEIVLEEGYATLFNFHKIKEFVRLFTIETN